MFADKIGFENESICVDGCADCAKEFSQYVAPAPRLWFCCRSFGLRLASEFSWFLWTCSSGLDCDALGAGDWEVRTGTAVFALVSARFADGCDNKAAFKMFSERSLP